MDRPDVPLLTPHELARKRQGMLGCGMAFYSIVLLGFFGLGLTGLTLATYTIFFAGEAASPLNLSYGGLTSPLYLAPLQAAGLIGPGESPDVYHAEVFDGSVACAVHRDDLLRLGPEGAFRMPLDTVTEIVEVEEGVRVVGEREVLCRFGPGEGAERFARMLRAGS